jgi:hypothetical protein
MVAEESPTKTHSHGGFFGAFRKKKGTATETVWVTQPEPQVKVAGLPPPSSSNVQVVEGAGSFVSTGSGSAKHQRRASRGGVLAMLFGLNQHHRDGSLKKVHQRHHNVLTKGGDRSDREEGGAAAAGGKGPQYQVYVNEEDLETRRERLRTQHEAGLYHQHQHEGSPAKRSPQQGRVERRTLVQPAAHHRHHA